MVFHTSKENISQPIQLNLNKLSIIRRVSLGLLLFAISTICTPLWASTEKITILPSELQSFSESTERPQGTCYEGQTPRKHNFCIYPGDPGESRTLLYFHGIGGSELNWGSRNHYSTVLLDLLPKWGLKRPQIISISFGPAWFLVAKNSASESGLKEALFQEILPKVEALLPLRPTAYWLVGESMGGFNAYYSGIDPKNFKVPVTHVVSLCPAMVEMSPYDSFENQERIRKMIGMQRERFISYLGISKRYVGNHAEWLATNPFKKTTEVVFPLQAKFHISCGDADEWGFHAGAFRIWQILSATDTDAEWRTYPGGNHCTVNVQDIVQFLGR